MKMVAKIPSDLDPAARKKWRELAETCDPDVDPELLANYCRQHSTMMAIREDRACQQKVGTFKTMVPGRDGTEVLNPLLVYEGRLVAGLNRMLGSLGLAASREGQARRPEPSPPPPGFSGPEPACGWEIEKKLCGP